MNSSSIMLMFEDYAASKSADVSWPVQGLQQLQALASLPSLTTETITSTTRAVHPGPAAQTLVRTSTTVATSGAPTAATLEAIAVSMQNFACLSCTYWLQHCAITFSDRPSCHCRAPTVRHGMHHLDYSPAHLTFVMVPDIHFEVVYHHADRGEQAAAAAAASAASSGTVPCLSHQHELKPAIWHFCTVAQLHTHADHHKDKLLATPLAGVSAKESMQLSMLACSLRMWPVLMSRGTVRGCLRHPVY